MNDSKTGVDKIFKMLNKDVRNLRVQPRDYVDKEYNFAIEDALKVIKKVKNEIQATY